MIKKIALLVAALTLTLPAFAQGTMAPAASAPAASSDTKPAKKHHSKHHRAPKNTDSTAPK